MDTAHEKHAIHGELLASIKRLRDQSAREWKRDPLLAKTLEHIRDYLEMLLSAKFNTESESVARAIWLDSLQNLDCLKLEQAFDVEADLRAILPGLLGDDYTCMCLQREQQRLTSPRDEDDRDRRWTDLFPETKLTKLLEKYESADKEPRVREEAIGRLVELYRQQHHDLRRSRAHAAQIGLYLKWLTPLLIVLLLVVATLLGSVEALDRPTRTWAEPVAFGVAMLAGAIGGVLGLMFRFRDTRGRIRDLLADRDVRWVQPLIGAAMALAIVLVMKSGLITIAGLTAGGGGLAPLAALGFVAGFSEPFFFGVMDRFARAASPGPSQGDKS